MKNKNIKSFEEKSVVSLKQIVGGRDTMDQQMTITDQQQAQTIQRQT